MVEPSGIETFTSETSPFAKLDISFFIGVLPETSYIPALSFSCP